MKKISKIIAVLMILIIIFNMKVIAHGGNITGWKDKDSLEITQYNGKYYGYHKEKEEKHYHQVEWNEENKKWIIVNSAVYYNEKFQIIDNNSNEESEKLEVTYYKSIDGDTAKFKLNDKIITVRFLGIDTPETVHTKKEEQPYGKEASNYTKKKLESAKEIKIEYDIKAAKQDQYGRELAWIWVDNKLLQEEIILNGLAKTYMLQNNYKYASELQLAQEQAKNNRLNIWSENTLNDNTESDSHTNGQNNVELVGLTIIIIIAIITIIISFKKKNQKSN